MTVYINYMRIRGTQEAPSAHLLSNLHQNALRYPDYCFKFWVEDRSAYADCSIPPNVTLCDLAAVRERYPVPILTSMRDSDFWSKVDISKLLILKETLKQPNCKLAVFADMDIADLKLTTKEFLQRIDRYGSAFGASFASDGNREFIVRHFENGFMAFAPEGSELLNSLVAETTRPSFFANTMIGRLFRHPRDEVYVKMSGTLHDWACARREFGGKVLPRNWLFEVAGFPIQPPCGWHAKIENKIAAAAPT
jgi:hypothetical protein